jgi:type VI secretion system secreted protein VgrG
MDIPNSAQDIASALGSMAPGHNDATRLIRLHTSAADGMPNALLVERLDGTEQIGPAAPENHVGCPAGFRFSLSAISADAQLEAADWLGKPVLIELLTAQPGSTLGGQLRPLHGHVTAFENLPGDGGFGYYKLTIEPWLSFLAHRQDSFVFHDMTIIEIVESIFADYSGVASLVPQWRWALLSNDADASLYPKRSITTQYRESDLAFIERLLAEEGLYYWFEHKADGSLASAQHTLVIADDTASFSENAQARIRYHRADSTETDDTIQQLVTSLSLTTNSIDIASWDYRSLDTRSSQGASNLQGSAPDLPLTRFDSPGAYLWPDRKSGERYAARQIEALEANAQLLSGSGTVRTLAPGSCFTLDAHFDSLLDSVSSANSDGSGDAANRYAVLSVTHYARNNLNPARRDSLTDASGDKAALYANTFTLLPAALPYRPIAQDANGITLRARPSASGTQTAIVVGTAGEPVHTDRDGRIKVQFHWQPGANSHSRLMHPAGDEHTPATEGAWAWVRVMTQWAGNNWGSSFTPRVGQEVLVDFVEGDIDRPLVIGTVYNGQGMQNAQNNQSSAGAGVATGNAPAWFAGEGSTAGGTSDCAGPKHAHVATLAGIKTQAMTQSQQGSPSAGYNQMVFDLTPGEPRTQLATTQFASSLTLGANRHQTDNQRLAYRGHGAELVTGESGAIRAGGGLLISTDGRTNANGMQLDSRIAPDQLQAAQNLITTLADSAQKQKADLTGEPAPDKHPSVAALAKSQEIIAATETGTAANEQVQGGGGTVPAWSEPMLVAESPAGIAALTPKDAVLVAGSTLTLAAADIHIASQGKQAWAVKDGIALYTYGKQSDANRPVKDLGLKLHAAKGKVSVQAQSDKADFNADKAVTLTSTTADILLQGKSKLTLTAGGAGIEIAGGNITLTASGAIDLKGAQRNLTSAKSGTAEGVTLGKPATLSQYNEAFVIKNEETGEVLAHTRYRIEDGDGNMLARGVTDENGHTSRTTSFKAQGIKLFVLDQ